MLPQEVHESQKFALMQAVVTSVVNNGLENSTARTIGALSGVNDIYIYRYFKNKDDLFAKTFSYADEQFLKTILDSYSVMTYKSIDFEIRCRSLFKKCWMYIHEHTDWLIFYIRYYYSQAFQLHSYEEHMKRYEILYDKMRPACHPKADVKTVLHHVLDTLLGQARKQILHPQDPKQAENDAFYLIYSVLLAGKQYDI